MGPTIIKTRVKAHLGAYAAAMMAAEKNKYFFFTTIVSTRPLPMHLFWLVWNVVHAGTPKELGENSVAYCDQLASHFC